MALFNTCWGSSAFPVRWKRAKLVFFYKGGGRPSANPGSFRPINLLDSAAKLYERMILRRLVAEIGEMGGLTIKQFGFRSGIGTVDAIH